MNKNASFECKMTTYEKIDDMLIPVKLRLMHDQDNRNRSEISFDVIEKAKETIKNKPILACIFYDEETGEVKDFGGHEIDLELNISSKGELTFKERYREFPVGIIPESTQLSYESIDGKMYLCCTGYIFEGYSNETMELLEKTNGKCVSVELKVKDGGFDEDRDVFIIKDFSFSGVTILGNDITPGMTEHCRIDFFSENDYSDIMDKFAKQVNDIEFKGKEEDESVENEVIEEVQEVEEVIENTDIAENTEDFTENIEAEVVDEPIDESQIVEEQVEEVVEETVDESITIGEDVFTKEEIQVKFERLKELEEFKANYDKEVKITELTKQVDEVVTKFSFEEDEISELKTKAMNEEINVETFELHMKALYCDKMMEQNSTKKANFSAEEVPAKLEVKSIEKEEVDEVKMAVAELKRKYL